LHFPGEGNADGRSDIAFLFRQHIHYRRLDDLGALWDGFKYSGVGGEFDRYDRGVSGTRAIRE
jgi:hypothetical protein